MCNVKNDTVKTLILGLTLGVQEERTSILKFQNVLVCPRVSQEVLSRIQHRGGKILNLIRPVLPLFLQVLDIFSTILKWNS